MTDTKHTPLPWNAIQDRDGFWEVESSQDTVCAFSYLVEEDHSVQDYDNGEANAHLIAASPLMAEYIKRKADEGCEEAKAIYAEATNAKS